MGRHIVLRNLYGVTVPVDPFDYMDGYVIREGFYESEIVEAMLPFATPAAVLWDVGANKGHIAATMSKLSPGMRVFAFEPAVAQIACLVSTMQISGSHFRIMPVALAEDIAMNVFHVCDSNTGRSSLQTPRDLEHFESTQVFCVTGDWLVYDNGMSVPTIIKLDVEGAEIRVLRGMSRILASEECRCVIFEAGNSSDGQYIAIEALLQKYAFSITQLARREATEHGLANYLAVKESVT